MSVPPSCSSGGQFELIYGSSDTVHASTRFGHLESIGHDTAETPMTLQKDKQESMESAERCCGSTSKRIDSIIYGLCLAVTGICCAAMGIGVHTAIFFLLKVRNEKTASLMYSGMWLSAFFSHISIALVFTLLAFMAVWCELTATGSGIPEVKSFLNGVDLSSAFRIRTMLMKAVSVVFAVSSGMLIGPDGPMIHMGVIFGVLASKINGMFRSQNSMVLNTARRDFATFGCAGAIAASFRAPFGGVLFALEEASTHASAALISKAFMCASVTYLIVVVVDKTLNRNEIEEISSNFSFGHFSQSYTGHMDYQMLELALFVVVGIGGGVLGSIFVKGNELCGKFRRRYIGDSLGNRFAEIMIVSMLTAWLTFTLPIMWGECTSIPDSADTYLSNDEKELVSKLVQYNCLPGYYNQAASLLFVDSNVAVKMMFHLREHMAVQTFSVGTLVVVFIPYFIFAIYTIGVMASVGAFIPLLMSGAFMGRIIGAGLIVMFPDTVADSGTYALVGAAAMLGGACRSVAAITVILMETTGNLQFALPLMISLVTARLVGDALSDGLYVSICAAREYVYLPEQLETLRIREGGLTQGKGCTMHELRYFVSYLFTNLILCMLYRVFFRFYDSRSCHFTQDRVSDETYSSLANDNT
jgi:chloride channel 7